MSFSQVTDDDLIALLGQIEQVGRVVDAGRVRVATETSVRSNRWLGHESLAWKRGCRTGQDLITRVSGVSGKESNRRVKLGGNITPRQEAGTVLPILYPVVAEHVAAGDLGIDSAEVIVNGLTGIASRADPDGLRIAETCLVASATGNTDGLDAETVDGRNLEGEVPYAGMAFSADLIRTQVQVWKARLDPDGSAPDEDDTGAHSTFGFGTIRNGLYPLHGGVTPELRGIMNTIFDTHLSAHTDTPAFPSAWQQARIDAGHLAPDALDPRTSGQKKADIIRLVFETASRNSDTPQIGGARPAVLVHVNATDLNSADLKTGTGVGWIDGVNTPIPLSAVTQRICYGGYQKVILGDRGEMLYLGGRERFFSITQRKAIIARDGDTCLIPGCTIPAVWAQAHHVHPWDEHNTDITNGVLLCWYHHHSLNTSGWQIRMINGKAHIKAPP